MLERRLVDAKVILFFPKGQTILIESITNKSIAIRRQTQIIL